MHGTDSCDPRNCAMDPWQEPDIPVFSMTFVHTETETKWGIEPPRLIEVPDVGQSEYVSYDSY